MAEQREVGHLASWSVSSAKPGNGVDQLRDGKTDTFWQSDGIQPHLINIQFQQRLQLVELHLYLDHKQDESYTPKKISVRAGTALHDLREIRMVDLEEPSGWIRVPLGSTAAEASAATEGAAGAPTPGTDSTVCEPLRAFCLQVAILANHQNGRDAHVRQIKVYSLRGDPMRGLDLPCALSTPAFAACMTVR